MGQDWTELKSRLVTCHHTFSFIRNLAVMQLMTMWLCLARCHALSRGRVQYIDYRWPPHYCRFFSLHTYIIFTILFPQQNLKTWKSYTWTYAKIATIKCMNQHYSTNLKYDRYELLWIWHDKSWEASASIVIQCPSLASYNCSKVQFQSSDSLGVQLELHNLTGVTHVISKDTSLSYVG